MGAAVQRSWGTYEVLVEGQGHKVKRLVMYPGKTFSHQYHHHRSEFWVLVSGCAEITVAGKISKMKEGDYVHIPVLVDHKLTNVGNIPVVIIETQRGPYLEEDDIVRLDGPSSEALNK